MSRAFLKRERVSWLGLAMLFLAAPAASATLGKGSSERKTNVVHILCDDLGYGLGVPKEQAAAIKRLVYSWVEPIVIPPPKAVSADK